ncbi:MAG TPA: hypothetical protein VMS02_02470 [Solirubrobacteraceae bacterium]|nr:hypothetical protein [Solirubrobacteraceae bacterium]
MRRYLLAGLATTTACVLMSAPCAFGGESLKVAVGADPAVGQPLSVTVEGVTNGLDDLYVFAATGDCAADPYDEATYTFEVSTLSGPGEHRHGVAEGEAMAAGEFKRTFTFSPWAEKSYVVCAYLDAAAEATPDVFAKVTFVIPEPGPVKAPYLNEATKEFSPVAIAEGQRKEREREQLEKEKAEREHPPPPASEMPSGEPPPAVNDSTKRCLVPALRGHSLNAARAALEHADCRLGAVKRPRRAQGRLVVVRQSAPRGSRLAADAAVAVVLGRRSR